MAASAFQPSQSQAWCSKCGAKLGELTNFCSVCGNPATPGNSAPDPLRISNPNGLAMSGSAHHAVAHGFAQTFGLHPGMALLTVIVNTMVFGGGIILPVIGWFTSIPVGVVLGGIVFMAQKKWYGDDSEAAAIKALIVAFLTAIPTSLPGYLTIPSGIVGFFRRKEY